MQFSLKSSLCRFIRKSFVGIFKMNTDSCFRPPRDGTSCHRTLEDLASWTRRPRFSGRRPQDCNWCRVTQYRRVGVLHQVTHGFCSPPQPPEPLHLHDIVKKTPQQVVVFHVLQWIKFWWQSSVKGVLKLLDFDLPCASVMEDLTVHSSPLGHLDHPRLL